MRALFSIVALLVVVFVVMQLARTQLSAVAPAVGGGDSAGKAVTTPSGTASAAAGRVIDALQQGAAGRASVPGQ